MVGGDNSGNWYHFFGTMNVRLVLGNAANIFVAIYQNIAINEDISLTTFKFNSNDDDEDLVDLAGLEVMKILEGMIRNPGLASDVRYPDEECQISTMNPRLDRTATGE